MIPDHMPSAVSRFPYDDIFAWYDRHGRALPWRYRWPEMAPVYHLWLSEIMLQQTVVATVIPYFLEFVRRWPTIGDLAVAPIDDVLAALAGLGYYARARNLHKTAKIVAHDHAGVFPKNKQDLLALPGIGPYTSAAIAAIAFDHAETVVDGNVERVMVRLFDLHAPLPQAKGALTSYAASLTPPARPGDYAQAVMDLGATICTPKSPRCALCPWHDICAARKAGTAAELPKKLPKVKKPTRFGTAYVARRSDGAVLLEQRPERGLLGGMLGWPGSEWRETPPDAIPPIQADWIEAPGEVRHTFTHFHLRLRVMVAQVDAQQTNQTFTAAENFRPADLPTVMRKIWSMAEAEI